MKAFSALGDYGWPAIGITIVFLIVLAWMGYRRELFFYAGIIAGSACSMGCLS